jgi:hypothetical protein
MAYIGRGTDKISNIEKLDTITFDGSSSYTLQKNSVNFTPNSANSLQVSIDGVVQAGNFTVSGSTIDFGVAVASTSTNDFIFHYGTGLITTPADGTITTAKIAFSEATLTDQATITWDAQTEDVCKVTLGDNRTLAAPTNGTAGQFISILVIQDGTGSRTLTWNAVYEFKDDTAPTLTTTASKGDVFVFRYNGTKWLEVGRNLNLTLS